MSENTTVHPVKQRSGGGPAVTKGTIKTAKRLLNYVFRSYKIQFIVVLICILMSSVASISVSLSLKFLLDDFIIPLIGQQIIRNCTWRLRSSASSSCAASFLHLYTAG